MTVPYGTGPLWPHQRWVASLLPGSSENSDLHRAFFDFTPAGRGRDPSLLPGGGEVQAPHVGSPDTAAGGNLLTAWLG